MSEPFVHFLNDDPVNNSMQCQPVVNGDYWIAVDGLMVRNSDEWEKASDGDSLQPLWTMIITKGNRQ